MNIINGFKTFLWVGFCFSCSLFFSCKDDTGQIGVELENPDNLVMVFNDSTTQIRTFTTERSDILRVFPAKNITTDFLLLGYFNDDRLGSFQNNFMAEMNFYTPEFKGRPVVDSLVFYLSYSYLGLTNPTYPSIYGDSTTQQTIMIYELKKDTAIIVLDSAPNTRENINTVVDRSRPLASFTFYPRLSDTVLRIHLPNELGERLLDTSHYSSLADFQKNLLRGLYFEALPTSGTGAITAFTIYDSTRMKLFYHDDSIKRNTIYYIGSTSFRCNTFNRNYNTNINITPFEQIPNPNNEQDLFYLKSNNGLESIIEISGIQSWADSGYIAINKAYMSLEPAWDNDTSFTPIPTLYIYKIADIDNNDFSKLALPDYLDASGYGYLYYESDSTYSGYKINIKQTLHTAIKNGEDKISLILTCPLGLNLNSPARTIFKGAKYGEQPLKLHITYSKFN